MSPLRIAIAGASGRMGRTLIEAVLNASDMVVAAAFEQAGSSVLGKDAGELAGMHCGVPVTDDVETGLAAADCFIDFTRPEGTMTYLAACVRQRKGMVIGTTGLNAEQKLAVQKAAETIPVVFAPNMSVGVNVVFKLLETAARILNQGYDIEIIEAHHRHKVDAPSGTALRMGEVVAAALGRDLGACAVYGRQGVIGERDPGAIGFATIRGGDIVGDHTVLFAGPGERVEICHKSASRMPYAQGSLRAARFLAQRTSGLFDMQDVLGLH